MWYKPGTNMALYMNLSMPESWFGSGATAASKTKDKHTQQNSDTSLGNLSENNDLVTRHVLT
jgi:hypothetical protein